VPLGPSRFWIGYIVLPLGHGKSYRHNPEKHIYEADTLVPCKSTPRLRQLRLEAKSTDKWENYDKEWARLFAERLPGRRVLLMVPSEDVGVALNGSFQGAAVLTWGMRERNFLERADSAQKHRFC